MYCVHDIDLNEFPKDITLKYGEEDNRIWYETPGKRKGIVIQGYKGSYLYIYFIKNKIVRLLKDEKDNIVAFKNINEALKALRELGFNVKLKKPYEIIDDNIIRILDEEFLIDLFRCSEIPPIASDDRTVVTFPVKLSKRELRKLLATAKKQYLQKT
jgi:hypothetical protein